MRRFFDYIIRHHRTKNALQVVSGIFLSFGGATLLAKIQKMVNVEFGSLAYKWELRYRFWNKFFDFWFSEDAIMGTVLLAIIIGLGLFFILGISFRDKEADRVERREQHEELITAINNARILGRVFGEQIETKNDEEEQ